MRKRTSAAEETPVRIVIVTMDGHLAGATVRARETLRKELPGLEVAMHSADEWGSDPQALDRCLEDIGRGDIVVATMLFLEDSHPRGHAVAASAAREL